MFAKLLLAVMLALFVLVQTAHAAELNCKPHKGMTKAECSTCEAQGEPVHWVGKGKDGIKGGCQYRKPSV